MRSVGPQMERGAELAEERVRERVHELGPRPAALLLRRLLGVGVGVGVGVRVRVRVKC